ncbi:SusC/RagA family TonB-linked outer membrane protein [Sinomicrobium sp.]
MRIFILLFCTTVFAFSPKEVLSQKREVTITDNRDYSVDEVFDLINQQTEYSFIYRSDLFEGFPKIFLHKGSINAGKLLGKVIEKKEFNVVLTENNTIIIRDKSHYNREQKGVNGTVNDEDGLPIPGVTVRIKGTSSGTFTDMDGNYSIAVPNRENVLVFTAIGFESQEITVGDASVVNVTLVTKVDVLDGVTINAGYYSTSERMRTGNISKVTSEELNLSPVVNPIAALAGKVPGMIITQNNGNPGSGFNIEIRGRTQIDNLYSASDQPLIIVDNVPIASGGDFLNNDIYMTSAISGVGITGLSPLYNINMDNIESIEVLKDADATAIYGSQGASGVVLITTKKAKAGSLKFDANISSGVSVAPLPNMLNTRQYVEMRKEALKNDGMDLYELANSSSAVDRNLVYDLVQYDTLRDNNLVKQLIGGTAYTHNVQLSLSGGSELTQFRLGGNYNRETSVVPGDFPNSRMSGFANISARSRDNKLSGTFSASYTDTKNTSPASDLSASIFLPPNYKLYEENGDLAWNEGGYDSDNPLAYLHRKYEANTKTLNTNVFISYTPFKNLVLKSSIGYNLITTEEIKTWPSTSVNPLDRTGADGQYNMGHSEFKSWIWEPQIEYTLKLGKGVLSALAGGSLQSREKNRYFLAIKGYENDRLIGSLNSVTSEMFSHATSSFSQYRYGAFFGRINYTHDNKYIINLSGRRDGSSRFGPDFRFSNFGAIGAAWIVSDEDFMQNLTAVSFAKLKASYGVTGNDNIGDYKYQDVYANSNAFSFTAPGSYNGEVALRPESLFNPTLHWEKFIKMEVSADVNFFMDRLRLSATWYRNNSSDPLVSYPLPFITGYNSVVANLKGVLIQNRGWELMLSSTNIDNGNFRWTSNFNITIPKNELKKFPALETSSYNNSFILGKSLNTVISGHVVGVNPETGLYQIEDYNGNGTYEPSYDEGEGDARPLLDTDPDFYGGFRNSFSYKGLSLDVFFQFVKKKGNSWWFSASNITNPAGSAGNNYPTEILNRWQNPGDIAPYQKFTTTASFLDMYSLTGHAPTYLSSMNYTDASFIRLKNVALSYQFTKKVLDRLGLSSLSIYAQAHNLLTITPYKVGDPETTSLRSLPPLKTVVMGIQLSL